MRQKITLVAFALCLIPAGLMAQKDSTEVKEPGSQSIADSTAKIKPSPVSVLPAIIDSNDDYNFLELYYYGPDIDGYYDIYDPWDIYPDREGDSRERDNDGRDSQERDAREE